MERRRICRVNGLLHAKSNKKRDLTQKEKLHPAAQEESEVCRMYFLTDKVIWSVVDLYKIGK